MSKYQNSIAEKDNHIKSLKKMIGILFILCLVFGYGWYKSPDNITVYTPADIRSSSMRPWWEVPPSTVYGFSYYIFQQLHRWPTDGEKDYEKNIQRLSNYFTPACKVYLEKDYKERQLYGELSNRERGVFEIPGRGYSEDKVKIIDQDNWIVILDLAVDEHYKDEPVKRVLTRYPLKVIRHPVDLEQNPWGLMIDCYAEIPKKLELEKAEKSD